MNAEQPERDSYDHRGGSTAGSGEGSVPDYSGGENDMKISAIDFSLAGDKYLGRSYEEMDCQAFVEKCMADVGYRRDLGGSNSWYRECIPDRTIDRTGTSLTCTLPGTTVTEP